MINLAFGIWAKSTEHLHRILKYDNNLNSYRWGFQIRDNEERLEWFKLDLDPSQDRGETGLSRTFPRPPALHRPNNVSSQRLVTDYLKALKNHAEYMLKERLPDVILRATPREYILTIPAVWSDLAKQKTKICAEAAGMGSGDRLHVISEPEAAAICVLEDLDPHFINVGDTFLVCDAGGG